MDYSLLYDKSVLLLPGSTIFRFSISPALLSPAWNFKIILSDDTTQLAFSTNTEITNNNEINITLYSWYSDSWIENVEPIEIASKNSSVKLAVKIRVAMNQYQPELKHIIVSVWKKE